MRRVKPAVLAGKLTTENVVGNLEKTLNWLNEIETDKMEEIINSAVEGVKDRDVAIRKISNKMERNNGNFCKKFGPRKIIFSNDELHIILISVII